MCGYMENRIKFLAKKQKKKTNATADAMDSVAGAVANDLVVDGNANVVLTSDIDDETMQDLVNRMKSVMINESSLDSIKIDLRTTRAYRIKMLIDKKTDLLESYPYFFTSIDLVCIIRLNESSVI